MFAWIDALVSVFLQEKMRPEAPIKMAIVYFFIGWILDQKNLLLRIKVRMIHGQKKEEDY